MQDEELRFIEYDNIQVFRNILHPRLVKSQSIEYIQFSM